MFIKSQMPWFQNMMAKKVLKTSKDIVAEINDPGTDFPEHSKQDDRNNVIGTIQ